MRIALLICVFLFTVFFQTTVLFSTQQLFSTFPLMLVVGCVLLHRTAFEYAFAYMVGTVCILYWFDFSISTLIGYIIAFILAVFLSLRVLSSRSLYALLGIGVSAFIIFAIMKSFISWSIIFPIHHLILFILLLYIGYHTSQLIELIGKRVFFVRSHV